MPDGEKFNAITHLVGASLALLGLVYLVVSTSLQGDPWMIVSCSVYGASLLLLYTFSTLYHSTSGQVKRVFQKLDHLAIYLLIAGTYTPLTLGPLRGGWGWSLFGTVWGLALVGILLELLFSQRKKAFAVVVYILMGWLIVIAMHPLVQHLSAGALIWLVCGGVLYTSGVAFYALDKKYRHFHGIWHLFVLAGSLCHYVTVLVYLA